MRFLRALFAPAEPSVDGFGQSLADDLRFGLRFRRCRRRPVLWRRPTDDERRAHEAHPLLGRFGDWTVAVASVDGRDWVVRDRMWHGWPDPPEFVFFAFEGGQVWSAADFDGWPRAWTIAD